MANYIHKTAIIHPTAIIGDNNYIGPYCVIGAKSIIGSHNHFTSQVSIDSPPEYKEYIGTGLGVVIGDRNNFREFITINSGVNAPTLIGNDGYFMRGSHFGHDAEVGDKVTLSCNSIVGGHTIISSYANLGLGAITHQKLVIGPGCMLGAGAVAVKGQEYIPWTIFVGVPAKALKPNDLGRERARLTGQQMVELEKQYRKKLVK